jgi:hypothetical protein
VLALATASCTENEYIIGALCDPISGCATGGNNGGSAGASNSGAGGISGGSGNGGSGEAGAVEPGELKADLTGSGPERLPEQLMGAAPSHFLIASDATNTSWPARRGDGFEVLAPAALAVGEPGPFADSGSVLMHANAATFSAESSWADLGAGALALEAVFRGEPSVQLLAQRDANAGLQWFLDAAGNLNLRLDAGETELVLASHALVPDAWHHCLALLDTSQAVAQLFCNGQAGDAVSLPVDFALGPVAAAATLGSAAVARLHWAQLGSWQAASWQPRGSWTDVARERFARLVGTYAEGSFEPVPLPEVRASGAYIDMAPSEAPEQRRLHPVGEHWPRIVCRPTTDAARTCGLLLETSSSRFVAPSAFTLDRWAGVEAGVTPSPEAGPTGTASLFAVTASSAPGPHSLEIETPFGQGPAVLSLFARAGSRARLQVQVVGLGSASFDLASASVLETTGTLRADVEAWGDGLMRPSFAFEVDAGEHLLRLTLLDDDSSAAFSGDGSVAAHLGDVELRFRSVSTPLPTFGTIQQPDHLAYPATSGNLPSGPSFSFSAELWLPATPLVADAAIITANAGGRYDPQINVFVRPSDGTIQYWGREANTSLWAMSSPTVVTDGALHELTVSLGPEGATLTIDGESESAPADSYDLSQLDRVEIGGSMMSSGPLTGIVRHVRIMAD